MDVTTISTLLGSIKTATDIAKLIKNSDLSLEKAETKLKLAELISALADAKIEVTEIQQSLLDRDAQIREFQAKLDVKGKLQWEQPYYWLSDGQRREGPFCQQCYDTDEKLMRLQGSGDGYWECKTCKNSYMEERYRAAIQAHNRSDYDPYDRS